MEISGAEGVEADGATHLTTMMSPERLEDLQEHMAAGGEQEDTIMEMLMEPKGTTGVLLRIVSSTREVV